MKIVVPLIVFAFVGMSSHAADWPQELGPTRTGYTPEKVDLSELTDNPEPRWAVHAGMGAASPSVVGNSVYVSGYFHDRADLSDGIQASDRAVFEMRNRIPKGMTYPRPNRPWLLDSSVGGSQGGPMFLVDEYALCFDLQTGELKWATRIADDVGVNEYHWPKAEPLAHDGKVYFHSWNNLLTAVDARNGDRLWQVDFFDYGATRRGSHNKGGNWTGPLVAEGSIIVFFDTAQTGTNSIALDPETGDVNWLTPTPGTAFRGSKSSMNVGEVDGRTTVLISGGFRTLGLDAATGDKLWSCEYHGEVIPPEVKEKPNRVTWPGGIPFAVGGVVVDYSLPAVKPHYSRIFAFAVEHGDTNVIWTHQFPTRFFGQMVVKDNYLYGLDDVSGKRDDNNQMRDNRPLDMGALHCINIKTGEKTWISDGLEELIDFGGIRYPTPQYIIAGDSILMQQHNGLIHGNVSPEASGPWHFVALPSERFGARGMTQPVVAHGRLLIRRLGGRAEISRFASGSSHANQANTETLFCFDVAP